MYLKTLKNTIEFNQLNSVSYIKSNNEINKKKGRLLKHFFRTVFVLDEDLLTSTVY